MMKNMMGVINLINESDELDALTSGRCLATVPFGGRYRLIDFVLSSMVNSGIPNVAVFAHTKYRSLMDHLGSGKHWDLHHRHGGLFILPPVVEEISDLSKGDLYHFYQHRDYFYRTPLDYVVITRSHMVCNINFLDVLAYHLETQADITLVCKKQTDAFSERARRVRMDDDNRIVEIQEHFGRLESDYLSMEMYVMKKELLLDLVETSLAQGLDHFVRNAVRSRLDSLKVYGYQHEGYVGVVNTIPSYYRHSMQLLQTNVWRDLFFRPAPVCTKVKDEPPTRYLDGSVICNALIANGCVIEGKVENSILFRGVKVGKGTIVKNSILMQNCEIGENSSVEHVILDKEVKIHNNRDLKGESDFPFIVMKRKVI